MTLNLLYLASLVLLPAVITFLRRADPFAPINFVSLMLCLGYLVPGILLSNDPTLKGYTTLDGFAVENDLLLRGLTWTNLGFSALYCGYYITGRRPARCAPTHAYSPKRLCMTFMVLTLLFVAASATLFVTLGARVQRGIGYEFGYGLLQPFTALGFTVPLFYFAFFHYNHRYRKWSRSVQYSMAGIAAALVLWSFATSGSRGGVLAFVLGILLLRHYLYRRVHLTSLLLVVGISFFLVIYLAIDRVKGLGVGGDALLLAVRLLYMKTFAGLESFMVVLTQIPSQMSYYHGELFIGANLYPFAPRLLFSTKPDVYGYNLFWEDYISLISAGRTENYLSLPGQLFADFGYIGILVGAFVLGYLLKRIYAHYVVSLNDRGKALVYVIFVVTVVQSLVFIIPTVYLFLQNFLLLILGLKFARRRSPHSTAPSVVPSHA